MLAKGSNMLSHLTARPGGEGTSFISMDDIKASMSELDSCFGILFPGVFDSSSTSYSSSSDSTAAAAAAAATAKSLSSSLISSSSQSLIWECDGEEVEVKACSDEEDGDDSAPNALENDDDDDDDDVAWEDDDEGVEVVEEDQVEVSMAPYTLQIIVPTTAVGVESADNAIVLHTLREIASHLTLHALPALQEWRKVLSAALGCYNHSDQKEIWTMKRKRASLAANEIESATSTTEVDRAAREYEKSETSKALRQVVNLEHEVLTMLNTRCNTLLSS
jgi:hypothetical protein